MSASHCGGLPGRARQTAFLVLTRISSPVNATRIRGAVPSAESRGTLVHWLEPGSRRIRRGPWLTHRPPLRSNAAMLAPRGAIGSDDVAHTGRHDVEKRAVLLIDDHDLAVRGHGDRGGPGVEAIARPALDASSIVAEDAAGGADPEQAVAVLRDRGHDGGRQSIAAVEKAEVASLTRERRRAQAGE